MYSCLYSISAFTRFTYNCNSSKDSPLKSYFFEGTIIRVDFNDAVLIAEPEENLQRLLTPSTKKQSSICGNKRRKDAMYGNPKNP